MSVVVPLLVGWAFTVTLGDPVDPSPWWGIVGIALVLAFVVWNGWALWLMRKHRTALLPGGATKLILDSGPFSVSRNPLYVGLVAVYLGIALLVPSVWALVLVPVAIAGLWWGAIAPEESYLSAKFGPAYDAYRARVRRWL